MRSNAFLKHNSPFFPTFFRLIPVPLAERPVGRALTLIFLPQPYSKRENQTKSHRKKNAFCICIGRFFVPGFSGFAGTTYAVTTLEGNFASGRVEETIFFTKNSHFVQIFCEKDKKVPCCHMLAQRRIIPKR
ncbi:MAG: hypothetical protein ACLFVO_07210 [Chloroflexaceae bacterium]